MATYTPLHELPLQYVDGNGDPLTSGTLEFYKAGTSTTTSLFSDNGTTSIGTSITLNSDGYPASGGNVVTLWRDTSVALKVVAKNSAGAIIWTSDNIPAVGTFDSDSNAKLQGIEEGADVTDATNVGAVVNGKQTRWIPVELMIPAVTSGCAALATTEITAGQPVLRTLDFDASSDEYAQFNYALPKSWNLGAVTFQAMWTHASGNTAGLDGVAWGLKAVAVAADDPIGVAFSNAVVVGIDAAQTANDLWVSAESGNLTIAGSPGADELVFFEVSRETSSTSPLDDLDIDAKLLGIKLFFTTDKLNDS